MRLVKTIFCLLSLLLAACPAMERHAAHAARHAESAQDPGSTMDEYHRMIQCHCSTPEVMGYLRAIIGRVEPARRDGLVVDLVDYLIARQPDYSDLLPGDDLPEDARAPHGLQLPDDDRLNYAIGLTDRQLTTDLAEIRRNGYLVKNGASGGYLDIDFRFVLNTFADVISDALKEYLLIVATEAESVTLDDGTLQVTPGDLAARLGRIERFRLLYPLSPLGRKLGLYQKVYLRLYLVGTPDAPVLYTDDDGQPQVDSDTWDSYQDFIKNYPGSMLARLLAEYTELLKQNNNQVTPAVTAFLKLHGGDDDLEELVGNSTALLWDDEPDDDQLPATVVAQAGR